MVNLYDMKLHEEITVSSDLSVIRVPGGWLYKSKNHTTFVPYEYEEKMALSYDEQKQELHKKLERNLGEDWTKAKKDDIIDVFLGMYVPF